MKWIKCSKKLPPKDEKFLFKSENGIGLGNWGQTYVDRIKNGNKLLRKPKYILILWPSDIEAGAKPYHWDPESMMESDLYWCDLPEEPK